MKGRETVKFLTSGTKYQATMTQWLWEKYVLPPTINNNAIIQIVSVEGYLIMSKIDRIQRISNML